MVIARSKWYYQQESKIFLYTRFSFAFCSDRKICIRKKTLNILWVASRIAASDATIKRPEVLHERDQWNLSRINRGYIESPSPRIIDTNTRAMPYDSRVTTRVWERSTCDTGNVEFPVCLLLFWIHNGFQRSSLFQRDGKESRVASPERIEIPHSCYSWSDRSTLVRFVLLIDKYICIMYNTRESIQIDVSMKIEVFQNVTYAVEEGG